MKKVNFILALGALWLAWCGAAGAQSAAKIWKIAVLVSSSQAQNAARDDGLRQGLRALSYEEGKNVTLEYRFADGKTERLAQLARELVDQHPDVIIAGGTAVAVAA